MSQDSKKIVAVVTATLALMGLAVLGGAVLVHGHGAHGLTYAQATSNAAPDPTIFPTVIGKRKPGLDLHAMFKATPATLASGKKLFDTDCAACHGFAGKGDGPAAVALHPAPRNFTSPKGWTRGYSLADIYVTLSEGIKGTGMGSFDMLAPPDRFAVAHYVESLGKFDHHDDQAAEIKQLDARYHLSQGTHAPDKVAVPVVMKHMAAEYAAPPAVRMPADDDMGPGARLCRRLIADPARAARVLAQVPDWRTNIQDFASVAMADNPRNGFRAAVATLDRTQWQTFHDALVARTPAPDQAAGTGTPTGTAAGAATGTATGAGTAPGTGTTMGTRH